jgi:predicted nucleic acid-binding protein
LSFIVDSSITLAWCFSDERTLETQALLDDVSVAGAIAPAHWPLEVLNGLAMAERRQRIGATERQGFADFLRDLPIELDTETMDAAWEVTARLAARHRITVYDAAYLELALRLGRPLATLDRDLRRAAETVGVELLGQ